MSQVVVHEQEDDTLLTFKEAMAYLRISRATLYRLMWAGLLTGHKVGDQWRFYRKDLRACVGREVPPLEVPTDGTPIAYSPYWYRCKKPGCTCQQKYAQVHAYWYAVWTKDGRRVSKCVGRQKPEEGEMSHFDDRT